jgi:Rab proteins geranylgeranyltransferase component A
VSIVRAELQSEDCPKLGFPRAYSLALNPQIIYARSALIPALVSSKLYRQLEFLAVGSWWIYDSGSGAGSDGPAARLKKIPGGREDVFADKTIDLKAKRSLMKFLKLVVDADAHGDTLEAWGDRSLEDFFNLAFEIPPASQSAIHALTLSLKPARDTTVKYSLPLIARHIASIGVFGPGFASVYPKWGGHAEIAQVACRAGAVGGGVYALGKDIEGEGRRSNGEEPSHDGLHLRLSGGDSVRTRWLAGSRDDLHALQPLQDAAGQTTVTRCVSIVSSPLSKLFPKPADGAPPPAVAVVVFPVGSLSLDGHKLEAPLYVAIHSSDTGECPEGQCRWHSSPCPILSSDACDDLDVEYLSTLPATPLKITYL